MKTSNRKLSRREFLRISSISLTGAVVAFDSNISQQLIGSQAFASEADERITTLSTYQEAPMLAQWVQQGVLPSVQQRLPSTPCVLPALQNVHKYDGLMRRGYSGTSDQYGPIKMKDHAFVWYDLNLNLVPRLCESWEVNATATEWTIHLRPGTRWSDGVEFTTEDMYWWYQHVLKDNRLTWVIPDRWAAAGQLMTIQVLDQYTIKFVFAQPNGFFIYNLTRDENLLCPSHYMKRYHIDFAPSPAALEAEAAAAGFTSWSDYYLQNRNSWCNNPARPGLGPWIAKNAIGQTIFEMERNPYYYCVNSENNQLPYIDTVIHRLCNLDTELLALAKSGQIDFQARGLSFAYYDDLKAHETTGGYKVVRGISGNHLAISLNHTTKEPRLRAFFQERKVRIALSLAVNRTAINTDLFHGLAVPRQYSPLSISPQYYPTLSNAYINYDVTQANALLDQAGYSQKDAQGFRRWNDAGGERISFTIKGMAQTGSAEELAVQKVIQDYAAVGVQAIYQYVDRSTFSEDYNINQIEAAWFGADRSLLPIHSGGVIFRGIQTDRPWACAWGLWYNDPNNSEGIEPPADHWIRTIWGLWDQIVAQSDPSQRDLLFRQIMDIWATELPMIGYIGEIPSIAVVKDNLHNFPAGFPTDDVTSDEQIYNPETYAWDVTYSPTLTINHKTGAPGSFFTIVGTNYPPFSTAAISLNGRIIETLITDGNGRLEFVLDTAQAGAGFYEITVKVNPEASTGFMLSEAAVVHPVESTAVKFSVPSGIANLSTIFLPFLKR